MQVISILKLTLHVVMDVDIFVVFSIWVFFPLFLFFIINSLYKTSL